MRLGEWVKYILPRSLFGRALLILVVPTILVQLVVAYIFFERHWDSVTRHMSTSLAGEVALLVHEVHYAPEARREEIINLASALMGIEVRYDPENNKKIKPPKKEDFPEFSRQLKLRLALPFTVEQTKDNSYILIRVQLASGTLEMEVSIKRLASSTIYIFLTWMIGVTFILLLVATLFLRNQIRPISKLAKVAESFGKGRDMPNFRPQGALEVRRAARAFMVMKERIKRQITTRVEMLAGISHDLRTPLTRMKLQLALLGDSKDVKELEADVNEMEKMIEEYLDFARGEGQEEPKKLEIASFLTDIAESYQRMDHKVALHLRHNPTLILRENAFRRVFTNLINNALRYGTQCSLTTLATRDYVEIYIDDDGPGIPEQSREIVFKAFTRLDPSRNLQKGGVGLGLTIARDIVLSHGGDISLEDVPQADHSKKGLRVIVRLPI